jgi:hypothetical protein
VSHKINVYFSGHGFLSDPLPEAIQRFNNRSANALAATFREEARPTFALNAAFVDESLYASADAAVEQDEADFEPGVAAPDAPRWRDRFRRAVRNGTVHAFLLLGMFFPAMAAAGPKGSAVEAAWAGPRPLHRRRGRGRFAGRRGLAARLGRSARVDVLPEPPAVDGRLARSSCVERFRLGRRAFVGGGWTWKDRVGPWPSVWGPRR